jgi:hypothetical protein
MNKNIAEEKNMNEVCDDLNKNKIKRKRDLTITLENILCFNCKKQIGEEKESSKIKCEGNHVCCNTCFQTAVNVAIKCKTNIVPCAVRGCENNYSEETVDNNVISKIGKQLSSFAKKEIKNNGKETSQTPKITSDSPKPISTRTIQKNINHNSGRSTSGNLVIDLLFFFFPLLLLFVMHGLYKTNTQKRNRKLRV